MERGLLSSVEESYLGWALGPPPAKLACVGESVEPHAGDDEPHAWRRVWPGSLDWGLKRVHRFEDGTGGRWDVVLGRASWGAFHALFVPRGKGEARQALLAAESAEEAARTLNDADPETLMELFRRSEPHADGS